MDKQLRQKKDLSLWMVILIVILTVYVLHFIIPAGEFERDGNIAIPGTWHTIEKVYLTPLDVILGMGNTALSSFGSLIISILIIAGFMGVINSTKVIDKGLNNLIVTFENKALFIIPCIIFAMGFFGCLGAMISTAVLFLPVGLSIAKRLKVDRKFAVALILLGSHTGFMSSPINTLTTVLGQEIAGITPYSGAGFRTIVTVINLLIVSLYLMWYAKKMSKTDQWKTELADIEVVEFDSASAKFIGRELIVLFTFLGSFTLIAIGAPLFQLTTIQIASIMFPLAIICGFIYGYDLDTTMKNFCKGAEGMVGILLFMVLVSAMTTILNQSLILDSIVYYFSLPLNMIGSTFAPIGMFVANAFINIFIGSGSGQTSVVMPIMAPLADIVGVSRQMAVLTLQYGDGFTNLFVPTGSVLLANLALSKVSLKDWLKILTPVYTIIFVVLCCSIFIGVAIGY